MIRIMSSGCALRWSSSMGAVATGRSSVLRPAIGGLAAYTAILPRPRPLTGPLRLGCGGPHAHKFFSEDHPIMDESTNVIALFAAAPIEALPIVIPLDSVEHASAAVAQCMTTF